MQRTSGRSSRRSGSTLDSSGSDRDNPLLLDAPQTSAIFPRFSFVVPEFIEILKRITDIGKTVSLLDDLGVKECPVMQIYPVSLN